MNNLPTMIITIAIGALLVLAGLYYGGSLLNNGTVGANANTMTNAGGNVALALAAWKADNPGVVTPPNGIADLVTGQYLRAIPQIDGITKAGGSMGVDATLGVVATVANRQLCDRINVNLKIPSGTLNTGAAAATAPAGVGSACYMTSAPITAAGAVANDWVYFLRA